jgi:alginate O-acetyltransferase complex protein AlgI
VLNLALLGFFKYYDLFASTLSLIPGLRIPTLGLTLPIGISFYTFQTMSYPIDVYRGQTEVQRSYVRFGTFVALFPQLIAGPIVRYRDIADQLENRRENLPQFTAGVRRFVVGLGKKVLIANNIGLLWDFYKAAAPAELTVVGAWLGALAFSLQIYFDFSGYSDMAIGLGRMLGFEFLENFNYPYISKSVTEFWRRWHISLGAGSATTSISRWAGTAAERRGSFEYPDRLGADRLLARRELDLPLLGPLLRAVPDAGKGVSAETAGKGPGARHGLHAAGGGLRLDAVRSPERLRGGPVLRRDVRRRRRARERDGPLFPAQLRRGVPRGDRRGAAARKAPLRPAPRPGEGCADAAAPLLAVLVLSTAYLVDATYNPFLYFRF